MDWKRFTNAVMVAMGLFLMVCVGSAFAAEPLQLPADVYVDDNWTQQNCPPQYNWGWDAFNNIQDGVNGVEPGGTVHVFDGVYAENVVINNSMTVVGEGSKPVLQGSNDSTATGDVGFDINASNVTVDNFEVKDFRGNASVGIYLSGNYRGCSITNNLVHNCNYGIMVENTGTTGAVNTVSNNVVYGSPNDQSDSHGGVGIIVWKNCGYTEIIGNRSYDNDRQGIFVGYSASTDECVHNTVSYDTVYNNGLNGDAGPGTEGCYGIQLWFADYNEISHCESYGHTNGYSYFSQGILLSESADYNTIFDNNIHDNINGIILYGPSAGAMHNEIYDNDITGNTGYGIRIWGSTDGYNRFYCNTLWFNGTNAQDDADGTNYWYKWIAGVCTGNYYDDWPISGSSTYTIAGTAGEVDPCPKAAKLYVAPAPDTIDIGQQFVKEIKYDDSGYPNYPFLLGVKMDINYDPAQLAYVSATAGDFFDNWPSFIVDASTPGVISIDAFGDSAHAGSGVLAYITFEAAHPLCDVVPDSGYVKLANTDLRNPDNKSIGHTLDEGYVIIVDPVPPTAFVSQAGAGEWYGPNMLPVIDSLAFEDDVALKKVRYEIDSGGWSGISGVIQDTCTFWHKTNFPVPTGGLTTGGLHTVYFRVWDKANNWSGDDAKAVYSWAFNWDPTPPTITSITLKDRTTGSTTCTNDSVVDVITVASDTLSGLDSIRFREDALTWTSWQPYSPSMTFHLSGSDGDKHIYCQIKDKVGNVKQSGWSNTIKLDRTPPTATGILAYDYTSGSPNYTDTTRVRVKFSGVSDASPTCGLGMLLISEDPTFATGVDTVLSPGTGNNYLYFELSAGDGLHWVYGKVIDVAENESAVYSDSIELDTGKPTFTVTVQDSSSRPFIDHDTYTAFWDVNLFITSYAKSPIVKMQITGDVNSPPTPSGWVAFDDTLLATDAAHVQLTTGEGVRKVYVELEDGAGNRFTVMDSIIKDFTAPHWGVFEINNNAPYTNDSLVDITTIAPTDDETFVLMMDLYESGGFDTGWIGFDSSYSGFPLQNVQGTRYARCKVMDAAGNISVEKYDGIYLDLTTPTMEAIAEPEGKYYKVPPCFSNFGFDDNRRLDAVGYILAGSTDTLATGINATSWDNDAWCIPSADFDALPEGSNTVTFWATDMAGNYGADTTWQFYKDTQKPLGTITLTDRNSDAAPGYTDECSVSVHITVSDPTKVVKRWRLKNEDGWITGYLYPADTTAEWPVQDAEGTRKMWLRVYDEAGNYDDFEASIVLDKTPPVAPTGASGMPGASVLLSWTWPADAWKASIVRYGWYNYPTYDTLVYPEPDYPPDLGHGWYVADVFRGATLPYEDSQTPDRAIYYYSIFTCDSAGNYSATAANVRSTSYFLGDVEPKDDGKVDRDDIMILSMTYGTNSGEPYWNDTCDVGPTDDGSGLGIPQPDGTVDFEDLMIFAQNYHNVPPTAKAVPTETPASEVAVGLEASPRALSLGDEFEVKVNVENAADVKGMHIALNFNNRVLRLVGVEEGALLSGYNAFFKSTGTADVDFSAAVLGGSLNGSGDIATIRFKVLRGGQVELTPEVVDLRSSNNNKLEVTFKSVVVGAVPEAFALSQNYPNPFNPNTEINYQIAKDSYVSLRVYNVTGQLIRTLVDRTQKAGYYTVRWDGKDEMGVNVASGIYFYRIAAGGYTSTRKMVLMK